MSKLTGASEMVDALLEKIPEDELRLLCASHHDGFIDFATPSILAELDRRRMMKSMREARARIDNLPWWRRIFQ